MTEGHSSWAGLVDEAVSAASSSLHDGTTEASPTSDTIVDSNVVDHLQHFRSDPAVELKTSAVAPDVQGKATPIPEAQLPRFSLAVRKAQLVMLQSGRLLRSIEVCAHEGHQQNEPVEPTVILSDSAEVEDGFDMEGSLDEDFEDTIRSELDESMPQPSILVDAADPEFQHPASIGATMQDQPSTSASAPTCIWPRRTTTELGSPIEAQS